MINIPTLHGTDPEQKRQEIKAYFKMCFKRYESLFKLVANEEAYFEKADPLRHPIIFYYGHTATFFINKFKLAKIINDRVDPKLESTFAVGVDEMSWDDLNEKHYEWPTVAQTQEYRNRVYDVVNEVIDQLPLELPITEDSPWWVIMMGIEHENIHLETSSVLIRQLSIEDVREDEQWKECTTYSDAPDNAVIAVREGIVQLGKDKNAKLFTGITNMETIPPTYLHLKQQNILLLMPSIWRLWKRMDMVMMTTGVLKVKTGETIPKQSTHFFG